MTQCDIHYELTDTFGGEANYAWARSGVLADFGAGGRRSVSDLAAVRAVKKALDWRERTTTENQGDMLAIRPRNSHHHVVCFVEFNTWGNASS